MHEEDIEEWYFNRQEDVSFQDYVCRKKALRNKDSSCLAEEGASRKLKGETGDPKDELWFCLFILFIDIVPSFWLGLASDEQYKEFTQYF